MQPTIDCHLHVGLVGDHHPEWGKMKESYRQQFLFKVFLLYGNMQASDVTDQKLHEKIVETIRDCHLGGVVCLALDPVYTPDGIRHEEASNLWVDNEYVLSLQQELNQNGERKAFFGASVHPYDPNFRDRVIECVNRGAVLLKWVPSAQQINLADARVADALRFLATVKDGKPLPLLLHTGREYAIPSTDGSTASYDFLQWSLTDRIANLFRGSKRWRTPDVKHVRENLEAGLKAGGVIIFAHAGLPYFIGGSLGKLFEHSDFDTVKKYLLANASGTWPGKCYADVSACCTPVRKAFFPKIAALPRDYVLFGSDFPTPTFELSNDIPGMLEDFEAVLQGHVERLVVPEDNLLDVNYRELNKAFPEHPMFTNLAKLIGMD